jgi:hypothetical protein
MQALFFRSCSHLVVDDLEVKDSMQMHVVIAYCWKVLVSRLFVTAPGWSPNTDGIHVSNSREVSIIDSTITTGILHYSWAHSSALRISTCLRRTLSACDYAIFDRFLPF